MSKDCNDTLQACCARHNGKYSKPIQKENPIKIIAIANQKGGVGKMRQRGNRVLLENKKAAREGCLLAEDGL